MMFKVNREPLTPELTQELREQSKTALSVLVAFLAFSSSNVLRAVALGLLLYTVSLYTLTCVGYFQGIPIFKCACLHTVPFIGIIIMATVELVLAVRSPGVIVMMLVLCILPPFAGGVQRMWWMQNKPATAHSEGCGCTSCKANPEV